LSFTPLLAEEEVKEEDQDVAVVFSRAEEIGC
jgi:hypothetical protein